ncbi:MAG: FAD-dependent oxidoreductase [Myxococcota bacterium]
MSRTIVCRCEDVTAQDVEKALALGHRHLEEVKRYTGFGTGPCEGKECQSIVARMIQRLGGRKDGAQPFTARPPIAPVTLRALARHGDVGALPYVPLAAPEPALAGEPPKGPLPERADVAIVGAGIQGLALAYELARRGCKDVVVLDKAYVNYGASGRNGGGVRLQWSTELNIRLMQESLEICQGFATSMGVNVWLRRGGYVFLARSEVERARLEKSAELGQRCGVPTRLLSPADVREVVPELDVGGVVAASYNPRDAVIFPWPFLWGYARGAERHGARVHTFTPVTALRLAPGGFHVETPRGTIVAERVVAAAGAWSPTIARMAGATLPTWPHRHEICSTEPLKPWLRPLVAEIGSGLYFSQSMRGEIVGGLTVPDDDRRINLASRLIFLREMARALLRVVPRLSEVKVLRQWAGPYDMTPDGHPIVGEAPDCPGLWLCSGFVGHGFMMAPAVACHVADAMTGRPRHALFHAWRPDRFDRSGARPREDMDLG